MFNKIARKIIQPSRVEEYISILNYAIKKGYKLVSLIDWYIKYQYENEKVLIIRHDVDLDTNGAYRFYLVEKELNARATYYFRWKTMQANLMQKMHDDGFEVSLHYETLASFAKHHGLKRKADITDNVLNVCKENLSKEINKFEKRYFKLQTICSHGDKRNRKLGISNHVLVDKAFCEMHNILFEVYDKEIVDRFDAYISDSSIYSGFEWQHDGTPYEVIDAGKKTVCLLTHPIHWNQSFLKNIKMLFKISFDNL